nr:bacitracin ABC transporter permease [Bacillus thuringiensis]
MKLEWKKHKLSSYFKGVAICIIAIFAAVSLMAWASKVEDELMFSSYMEYMSLAIVFSFCFVSTIIATFIISLLIFCMNPIIGILETPVTMGEIIATVPTTIISAFMISGISLIPLFFGMRKKSTPTTITSAVIIGMLINGNVGPGNGQVSMFDFIAIPIVLCLLGIFISYLSYRKIDKIDVA